MRKRFYSNTVRAEGGLLPRDILAKVQDGEGLAGLDDASFDLGDERLRDAVTTSWHEALTIWVRFRRELRDRGDQAGTAFTREKLLLPVLDLLGWEPEAQRGSVTVEGVDYPISHLQGSTPLHLVDFDIGLDERAKGVAGAARLSPHSLVQQFLNRSDDHLWGIVTNGRQMRIVRDSVSITRQAYVEVDLEAMLNGQVFADFLLLYRLAHRTRFEGERPENCLLESWVAAARDEGIRALDQLRDGVESALETLGTGFLSHPANDDLRASYAGTGAERDLYRHLLRLVYRLLFLFVAEDRDLLLTADADAAARDRYARHYGSARIRDLSTRLADPVHGDLWEGLKALMSILGSDDGEPRLGLVGLGSFLWDPDSIGPLAGGHLDNAALLGAIRGLSTVDDGTGLRRIDFAALGAEELGSVYESLLELHPRIEDNAFSLGSGAGSERKTTGSYYTPTELIVELLDSALDPVLEEAATSDDPESAILDLKVVDPAAGSGHFLVAAAHRIGRRLAQVRSGELEPPAEVYRTAVRDVVSNCLYAVDLNDLAVELCKVSLWLEAVEPGRPLSFLDHHIVVGNSLIGATPASIAKGIPDDAFVALTGDDKPTVKSLKARNAAERKGQRSLGEPDAPAVDVGDLEALESFEDDDLATVRAKADLLRDWKGSEGYRRARLAADVWCAAFAAPKTPDDPPITQETLRRALTTGQIDTEALTTVERLARDGRWFHWHLEFPQVFAIVEGHENEGMGWSGGFDVVLGNPPWNKISFQEREWFSPQAPDVAAMDRAAPRRRAIAALEVQQPLVWDDYVRARHKADAFKAFARNGGRFPTGSAGDTNTYLLFTELAADISRRSVGLIVPSGLATDHNSRGLFSKLLHSGRLVSLFEFENEGFFAIGKGHMNRFCLLTLGSGKPTVPPLFMFRGRRLSDLKNPAKTYELDMSTLRALNPDTQLCPIFDTRFDAQITITAHHNHPLLAPSRVTTSSGWVVSFLSMLHPSSDAHLFIDSVEEGSNDAELVAVFEAKMIHQFDHRFGDYALLGSGSRGHVLPRATEAMKRNPDFTPTPRRWVTKDVLQERRPANSTRRWFAGWRDVTDSRASARTTIVSTLPYVAVDSGLPLLVVGDDQPLHLLCANLNSIAFDFLCRQKVGGNHLAKSVMRQLPVIPLAKFAEPCPWDPAFTIAEWLSTRVLELGYTSWDLADFARELGESGPPFAFNEERRWLIMREIDAAFLHLYGFGPHEASHLLNTFEALHRRDESRYGHYRTKEVALEVLASINQATAGSPYESLLEPGPGSRHAGRAESDPV